MIHFLLVIRHKPPCFSEVGEAILDSPDLGLHIAADNIGQCSLKQWNARVERVILKSMHVYIDTDTYIYMFQ